MIRRKGGLGRGLDALLGVGAGSAAASERGDDGDVRAPAVDEVLRRLPVGSIVPGRYQPRQNLREESLQELADSIRVQGVVQPIVVRCLTEDHYELIAGERRWRAAQLAGLTDIPAVIRTVPDQAAIAMALVENIQREDLDPLEEAAALQRLIQEFDLSHQQAGEAVGRSRAAVSNLLRLLELSEDIQRLLHERKLDMGHARALLPLPLALQQEAARQVLLRGLSVRETEELVRRLQQPSPTPVPGVGATPPSPPDPDLRVLQDDLSERLGARVRVRHGSSGKGCLMIHYSSLEELDGILARVN